MGGIALSTSEKAFNVFRFRRAMHHVTRDEILEPAKVTVLTAHAVMTGDKFLAAQILSRLGTLPKGARELGFLLRQELERIVVGDGDQKAYEAIAVARNAALRGGMRPATHGQTPPDASGGGKADCFASGPVGPS